MKPYEYCLLIVVITGMLVMKHSSVKARNCPDQLGTELKKLARDGRFHQLVGLYRTCKESVQDSLEKEAMYVEVVQAYLELDSLELARGIMKTLLNHSKYFVPSSYLSQEFIYQWRQFQVFARFSAGLHALMIWTIPRGVEPPLHTNLYQENIYKSTLMGGPGFGLSFGYQFNYHLGLGYELNLSAPAVRYKVLQEATIFQYDTIPAWRLEKTEQLTFLRSPVFLTYRVALRNADNPYRERTMTPFGMIFMGGQFSYLLKSNTKISWEEQITHPVPGKEPQSNTTDKTDLTAERNRIDYGLIGGLGVEFDYKSYSLYFQARTQVGFVPLISPRKILRQPNGEPLFMNSPLSWDFHVPNGYRSIWTCLTFVAGIKLNLAPQIQEIKK
ncbi:MAG: outer membrane beta-barrel protein [Bacteroidia bacterium]|nr:outer membrane beta-barrel protein [Bacteroidia bacterium]